jgi:ankyrin repeat protein
MTNTDQYSSVDMSLWDALSMVNDDGVRLALANGANPNRENPSGLSPLCYAIYYSQIQSAIDLLEAGAQIMPDGEGKDPWTLAITAMDRVDDETLAPIITTMLHRSADPNHVVGGNTAFYIAMSNNRYLLAKILIEAGTDLSLTHPIGGKIRPTPLYQALSVLTKNEEKVLPLVLAIIEKAVKTQHLATEKSLKKWTDGMKIAQPNLTATLDAAHARFQMERDTAAASAAANRGLRL